MGIFSRLKSDRVSRKISLVYVAYNVGVNRNTLRKYEMDDNGPVNIAEAYAKVLGYDLVVVKVV